MTHRIIWPSVLLLVGSAYASVLARQLTSSASDVGTQRFVRVASTASSGCPQNITYNSPEIPALFGRRPGFGIEASVNFTDIEVNGAQCRSDTGAALVLLSQDELRRLSPSDAGFLKLPRAAQRKVFIAAFDSQRRVCGPYKARDPMYYAFIKEIDAFRPSLLKLGVRVPNIVTRSGEKWMVTYDPQAGSACAYIDSDAASVERARRAGLNITAPDTPAAVAIPPGIPASPFPIPPVVTPAVSPGAFPEASPGAGALPIEGEAVPSPSPMMELGGRVCFPGAAEVELSDGTRRSMRDLRVGDRVRVSEGEFSEVFMFTHRRGDVSHEFVRVVVNDGRSLELTSGHFLYVNGALAPASSVRVGDVLADAARRPVNVASVECVGRKGLYNPQTVHGDIVVQGLLASTYTRTVAPGAAHALLVPLRAMYARFGLWTAALHSGMDPIAAFLPALA